MSYVGSEALLDAAQLAELDVRLQDRLHLTADRERHAASVWAMSIRKPNSKLRQLEQANPSAPHIVVFCDNARYYKSKAVAEYLATSRIRLVPLPPYSPNLNLIERFTPERSSSASWMRSPRNSERFWPKISRLSEIKSRKYLSLRCPAPDDYISWKSDPLFPRTGVAGGVSPEPRAVPGVV